MRLLRIYDYKNVLDYIKPSSDELREMARGQKLGFINVKNDIVEWNLKLPVFARTFYAFLYYKRTIPTQEEFFMYYLRRNRNYFEERNFSDDLLEGIKARAFRAMPSLTRDICFSKLVAERLPDCGVLYNIELDFNEGIDLLVFNKKGIYGICLFTDTQRAYEGRNAKENRHKVFDNVTYIELPVKFTPSHRVGNYYLYGEKEYQDLINKLNLQP